MNKYILLLILAVTMYTPVNAKNHELPYTYKNPHVYNNHGITYIEWHNNTWGEYVVYKRISTKTILGVNYKYVPIWYKYIAPDDIKISYREIGYTYIIQRIR